MLENIKEAMKESKRERRRRRLADLEIAEEDLKLTNEVLGKGGFGTVYLADLNGRNAAAKVFEMEHDLADSVGPDNTIVEMVAGKESPNTPSSVLDRTVGVCSLPSHVGSSRGFDFNY